MSTSPRKHLTSLLLAILAIGLLSPAYGQTLQIDALKANYLEGFIDFIRKDGEISSGTATIGVMGGRELVQHLSRLAERSVSKRQLKIVQINSSESIDHLDILFIGSGQRSNWSSIATACRSNRILSVGEEEGFVQAGGCIEFVVRKNRLRFIISQENTRHCGIDASSKLVSLGVQRR